VLIAVDATSIGSGLGGDETLVRGVLRGLVLTLSPDDRVVVLAAQGAELPAEVSGHAAVTVERRRRRGGIRHFAVELPLWLRSLHRRGTPPDVVLCNTHAPVRSASPVCLLVTDLSFLRVADAYPTLTRWRLRLLVAHQVRRVRSVLTISEFCRQDIERAYGLDAGAVHVVPLSVERSAPTSDAARERLEQRGVQQPYLLYLGNRHPRKNVPRSVATFLAARSHDDRLASHRFVVAGGRWFGDDAVERMAAAAPPGSVIVLDRVDDEEREVLLQGARALVYLSTFEGFGLPPLEAMARDTPVVASDVTAVPEVCGDAAVLVGPHDDEAIERGLVAVLLDDELRARLVRRGRQRVAHYDVRRTGEALYEALRVSARSEVVASR
jgi:alpha-1,3-rhamnosyl/mannosyltransferase